MAGIEDIAKTAGVKKDDVQSVFEAIVQLVGNDEVVRITGFGSFQRRLYKGRSIESPIVNDGKPLPFRDAFALRFKQSMTAKHRLNVKARKTTPPPAVEAAAGKDKSKTKPVPSKKPKLVEKPKGKDPKVKTVRVEKDN